MTELKEMPSSLNDACRKLDVALTEIERLRAALQRYGLHTWECAWNDSGGEKPCDCGWDAYQQTKSGHDPRDDFNPDKAP